jgi:excinuclease UvrABC nuclease subunit
VDSPLAALLDADYVTVPVRREEAPEDTRDLTLARLPETIERLRRQMREHARKLEFEAAAELRDRVKALEEWALEVMG